MSDTNDEHLLNGDEDDLDYDLDETEEALLLDDDDKSDEPEEFSEADISLEQQTKCRREEKFSTERKSISAPSVSSDIPDTLEEVEIDKKTVQNSENFRNRKPNFRPKNNTFNRPRPQRHVAPFQQRNTHNRRDNPQKFQRTIHTNPRFAGNTLPWEHQSQSMSVNNQSVQPWATNIFNQTGQSTNNLFLPPTNPLPNQPPVMLGNLRTIIPQIDLAPQNPLLTQNQMITPNNQGGLQQRNNILPLLSPQNQVNQFGTFQAHLGQQQFTFNNLGHLPNNLPPTGQFGAQQNVFSPFATHGSLPRDVQQSINVFPQPPTYNNPPSYQQNSVMDFQIQASNQYYNAPVPFNNQGPHYQQQQPKVWFQQPKNLPRQKYNSNDFNKHNKNFGNRPDKRKTTPFRKNIDPKKPKNDQRNNIEVVCNLETDQSNNIKVVCKHGKDQTDHSEPPAKTEPAAQVITIIPEDEDDETKQYRKKIEEQKKKREEVLRNKEERRKLAAAHEHSESLSRPSHLTVITTNTLENRQYSQQLRFSPPKKKQNFKNIGVNPNIKTIIPVSNIKIIVPNETQTQAKNDTDFNNESYRKVSLRNTKNSNTLTVTTNCNTVNKTLNKQLFESRRVLVNDLSGTSQARLNSFRRLGGTQL